MKPEEALSIVAQACGEFRGTLKDHQTIQEALQLLAKLIAPDEQDANHAG